jgi:hypothetical protein
MFRPEWYSPWRLHQRPSAHFFRQRHLHTCAIATATPACQERATCARWPRPRAYSATWRSPTRGKLDAKTRAPGLTRIEIEAAPLMRRDATGWSPTPAVGDTASSIVPTPGCPTSGTGSRYGCSSGPAALPVADIAQRLRLGAHQWLGERLHHLPQQMRGGLIQRSRIQLTMSSASLVRAAIASPPSSSLNCLSAAQ